MIVSIRELANKFFLSSAFNLQPQQMTKIPSNMDMNMSMNIIREMSMLQFNNLRVGWGKKLLWSMPHIAWLRLPLHLPLFSLQTSFILCLYINLEFLKYFCPHIDFLILYIHPIHQLAFVELSMLDFLYCFKLDFIGLLISWGYLRCSLSNCFCLLSRFSLPSP